jgi:uncharacterized protein YodC (DUF2158 family)
METDNIPIQVGDVVRLKSGGHKMTVTHIGREDPTYKNKTVLCEWFNNDHALRDTKFSPEALVKIQEDKK